MSSKKLKNIKITQDPFLNKIKEVQNGELKSNCKFEIHSLRDLSLYDPNCILDEIKINEKKDEKNIDYINYIPKRKKINEIYVNSMYQDILSKFDEINLAVISDLAIYEEQKKKSIKIDNFNSNNLELWDVKDIQFSDKDTKNINLNSLKIVSDKYFKNYKNTETFFENLPKYKNLKNLILSDNQIRELPESIGNLENLESLDLRRNKLEDFPESFEDLKNLRYLDLGENKLRNIPTNFGNLKNLEILYLEYNPLVWMPENIFDLPNLFRIDLRNTSFKEFSK